MGGDQKKSEKEVVIPVIEEKLKVGKKQVEKGKVQIHKEIEEEEVPILLSLSDEKIEVERVPVNIYIETEPPGIRQEGDTMVIPVFEEVVEKRLVLKEEVRVTKRKEEYTTKDSIKLKREKIQTERK